MKTSNDMRKAQVPAICFRIFALLTLLPTMIINAQTMKFPDKWTDGYAFVNGIRIHYYHAKPAQGKQVMVMVHGHTDIGLSWTTLALKLQDAYDIYLPDDRGHGLSDPFTDADNGETLIKDVVDFVHVMKFEKPILMGHSMGAATVMRVGVPTFILMKYSKSGIILPTISAVKEYNRFGRYFAGKIAAG